MSRTPDSPSAPGKYHNKLLKVYGLALNGGKDSGDIYSSFYQAKPSNRPATNTVSAAPRRKARAPPPLPPRRHRKVNGNLKGEVAKGNAQAGAAPAVSTVPTNVKTIASNNSQQNISHKRSASKIRFYGSSKMQRKPTGDFAVSRIRTKGVNQPPPPGPIPRSRPQENVQQKPSKGVLSRVQTNVQERRNRRRVHRRRKASLMKRSPTHNSEAAQRRSKRTHDARVRQAPPGQRKGRRSASQPNRLASHVKVKRRSVSESRLGAGSRHRDARAKQAARRPQGRRGRSRAPRRDVAKIPRDKAVEKVDIFGLIPTERLRPKVGISVNLDERASSQYRAVFGKLRAVPKTERTGLLKKPSLGKMARVLTRRQGGEGQQTRTTGVSPAPHLKLVQTATGSTATTEAGSSQARKRAVTRVRIAQEGGRVNGDNETEKAKGKAVVAETATRKHPKRLPKPIAPAQRLSDELARVRARLKRVTRTKQPKQKVVAPVFKLGDAQHLSTPAKVDHKTASISIIPIPVDEIAKVIPPVSAVPPPPPKKKTNTQEDSGIPSQQPRAKGQSEVIKKVVTKAESSSTPVGNRNPGMPNSKPSLVSSPTQGSASQVTRKTTTASAPKKGSFVGMSRTDTKIRRPAKNSAVERTTMNPPKDNGIAKTQTNVSSRKISNVMEIKRTTTSTTPRTKGSFVEMTGKVSSTAPRQKQLTSRRETNDSAAPKKGSVIALARKVTTASQSQQDQIAGNEANTSAPKKGSFVEMAKQVTSTSQPRQLEISRMHTNASAPKKGSIIEMTRNMSSTKPEMSTTQTNESAPRKSSVNGMTSTKSKVSTTQTYTSAPNNSSFVEMTNLAIPGTNHVTQGNEATRSQPHETDQGEMKAVKPEEQVEKVGNSFPDLMNQDSGGPFLAEPLNAPSLPPPPPPPPPPEVGIGEKAMIVSQTRNRAPSSSKRFRNRAFGLLKWGKSTSGRWQPGTSKITATKLPQSTPPAFLPQGGSRGRGMSDVMSPKPKQYPADWPMRSVGTRNPLYESL